MYETGQRIELIKEMIDEPHPVLVGTKGTINHVADDPFEVGCYLLGVKWDNSRTLGLCTGVDRFKVI